MKLSVILALLVSATLLFANDSAADSPDIHPGRYVLISEGSGAVPSANQSPLVLIVQKSETGNLRAVLEDYPTISSDITAKGSSCFFTFSIPNEDERYPQNTLLTYAGVPTDAVRKLQNEKQNRDDSRIVLRGQYSQIFTYKDPQQTASAQVANFLLYSIDPATAKK